MKRLILLTALVLAAGKAHALSAVPATAVNEVVPQGVTCSSQTIGTSPVEITGNTTSSSTTAGIFAVKVADLNTANNVYCSHDASVASSGNHIGDPVVAYSGSGPYNYLTWAINKYTPWYCISAGANTSIMVCLAKGF